MLLSMFSLALAPELLKLCHSASPTVILLMDLYEIRGGRLGVIAEEAELQEVQTDLSSTQPPKDKVSNRRRQAALQKSLPFEQHEQSSPSLTGEDDRCDDVFREEEIEVSILLPASILNHALMKFMM